MNIKKITKLFCGCFAFLLSILVLGCEGPSNIKSPVNNDPESNAKYPRIDSVFAESENTIFNYGESIKPDVFSVYYLESADQEPVKLEPAAENTGGFLINGRKGEDYVQAGITNAGQPGKYGEFTLTFTSSEDPAAKPYEYKVFVTTETLNAADTNKLTKLELVREPYQMEYDRGELFNSFGMMVVAWFDGETPGDTIAAGAKPLLVQSSEIAINEDELKAATTPNARPKIKVTYEYIDQIKELEFQVTLKIANHAIYMQNEKGITFLANNLALTGSYVTITVQLDSDYEMLGDIIDVTTLDGNGNVIGPLAGSLTEISPDGTDRRFVFVMPRRAVRISAQTVQKASGLGVLNYKTKGTADFVSVPGFVSGSHHLSYQLLIPADVAEQDSPLVIQAGPPSNLPAGSSVTVEIFKDNVHVGTTGISGTNNEFAEHSITSLASGKNHDYKIRINYKAPGDNSIVQVRDYTLRIMKESGTQSVTFTHTGDYQTFIAMHKGWYKIEGWGANGGNAGGGAGGKGGYGAGFLFLDPAGKDSENIPLYIYAGGAGGNLNEDTPYIPGAGGWNGGGQGGESGSKTGAGGGGAASISTVAGAWNSIDVLANRIFVVGGGGGASPDGKTKNAHISKDAPYANGSTGGGLSGSPAVTVNGKKYGPYQAYLLDGTEWKLPGTYSLTPGQVSPMAEDPTAGFNGQGFGQGGYGREGDLPVITNGNGYNGKGGGGGGWWGGRVSLYRGSDQYANNASAGGGGGSSYISGHTGSYAVSQVTMDYNAAAGSYNLSVTSKDASSVYEGTGKAPSANSPNIGAIVFKNTVMNETLNVEPNVWEANPNDTRLNPFPDGHGRIIITYIGGDDSNAPPPGGI